MSESVPMGMRLRRTTTLALLALTLAAGAAAALGGPRLWSAIHASPLSGPAHQALGLGEPAGVEAFVAAAPGKLANRLAFAWLLLAAWWMARHAVATAGFLAAGMVGVAAFTTPRPGWTWQFLLGESSVVGVTSAVAFLLAAAVLITILCRQPAVRNAYRIGLAVLLVVFFGEETSWLQHLIGYGTPEPIARINDQGELNLHNLIASPIANQLFLVLSFFLFLLVPSIRRAPEHTVRYVRRFALGFGLYFLIRSLLPLADQQALLTAFLVAAVAGFGTTALFPQRIVSLPLVRTVLEDLPRRIHFPPGLLRAAAILLVVYVLYGLRFRCLGDLEIGPHTYEWNFDDEVLEFFSAFLFVRLAAAQRRAEGDPFPEGGRR